MSAGQVEHVVVGPIETNCYLIDDGQGGVCVVDPGAEWPLIEEALAGRPVSMVLATHFHDDHVGALNELVAQTGAPWVIGRLDAPLLDGSHARTASYIPPAAQVPPARLLDDGDVVEAGTLVFRVIACPGHTAGGVSYIDDAHGLAFVGDTLFSGSAGRTDLLGGDEQALLASLKRLAALPGGTRVLCGHGPATTIQREVSTNRFMRYVLS